MKSYNTIYYLLFVLLIMGAFAAMAQNSYGFRILGGVALAFGLIFLYQCIENMLKKEKHDTTAQVELVSMSVLSFIFALRIFLIRIPFAEWIFEVAGILLILVYLKKLVQSYGRLKPGNMSLALLILVFYLSLILFILSLVAAPLAPQASEYMAILAFVLLAGFLVTSFIKKEFFIEGENTSAFKVISLFKDRSVILISLFFIVALFTGFSRIGVLPKLYSDQFPQAYFKLVNNAETGKEKPVNGKYRHEEFKAKYDQFVERNIK
jgi:hypothetical protein